MKRYKVKDKFERVVQKIIPMKPQSPIIFDEGSDTYVGILMLGLDIIDEFCEEIKQEWKDPNFEILKYDVCLDYGTVKKINLLARMQSWADYHNKEDGFVANWNNEQRKYGIVISVGLSAVGDILYDNLFLFQIAVSSQSRAATMHGYFHNDIQELIKLKMI